MYKAKDLTNAKAFGQHKAVLEVAINAVHEIARALAQADDKTLQDIAVLKANCKEIFERTCDLEVFLKGCKQ